MVMDHIKITGLEVYGHHGVFQFEKDRGQTFVVNAEIYYDMSRAIGSDRIREAINYAQVCQLINQVLKGKSFDLLEAAAECTCNEILFAYPQATKVVLELCKPMAPIELPFQNVSVVMERGWRTAIIALGANQGDCQENIQAAIDAMRKNPMIRVQKVSDLITTKPYGVLDQPDFVNGAMEIDTLYSPEALLEELHRLEAAAGRVRTLRWGPRTLDLDIIFFDDMVYHSQTLTIPHVDMENRDFVLEPLAQISPFYLHPLHRKTVIQLLEELKAHE